MAAATETEALRAEAALALEYQSEAKKNNSFMSNSDKKAAALRGEREQFKKSAELSSQSYKYQHVAKKNNSSSGMKNNNSSVQSHSDKKPAATFPSFRQIGNKFESQVSTLSETCVCRCRISLNPSQICVIAFHILLAGGLLYWASDELHQRLQNPSEYHYTTCFITKMRAYEGLEDEYGNAEKLKDITFVYGFSNNDWDQVGTYTSEREDWSGHYKPGDIGTCLYTLNKDRSHVDDSPLTVRNYLIHQDTAAMWMVLDDKYIWINYIIFFTIACLFTTCFAKYTASGPVGVAFLAMCGVWIFAFWVANWPLFIMASIVEGGFSGALSHGATVDDVYINMNNDCRIDNVVDTVYFEDKFSLVKYDVFTTDNGTNRTMMAIDCCGLQP
eukprot:619428_1